MAKQRRNGRKWLLILLLVLPLGLLAGLLIGRAVDPDMLFQGERVSSGSETTTRADSAVDRRNNELLEEDPSASLESGFDNEEDVWTEEQTGRRREDPGEYGYYSEEEYSGEELFSDEALFGDDYRPRSEQEAESRAQASGPAATTPDPSARYAPLRERSTRPAPAETREPAQPRPSEPRTADGDLPAIW